MQLENDNTDLQEFKNNLPIMFNYNEMNVPHHVHKKQY